MGLVVIVALFVSGSVASLAWCGAHTPKHTHGERRMYGLLALACWLTLMVLANAIL
jgi:hypothetical protein